jgi:hypothetical protein
LKKPLLSDSQSTNEKASVQDSASSSHNQATVGESEQFNKPLQADPLPKSKPPLKTMEKKVNSSSVNTMDLHLHT